MKLKRGFKRVAGAFLKPIAGFYLQKDRWFRYKGLKIKVKKGVFHPGLFFSTQSLLKFLQTENVTGKSLLELGCGTGLISVVVASDINADAVSCTQENAKLNRIEIKTVVSDLFDSITPQTFNYIIINPPFYKGAAKNDSDKAWYCGEDFEYFEKLFSQLKNFSGKNSKVLMVLSDDCDLKKIKSFALKNNLHLLLLKKYLKWMEYNYIYRVE
jgi:release factor glutamine methyltransferase